MDKEITVIKLGGSLLTDKSTPYKLRDNIGDIGRELRECMDTDLIESLVLIHGVGSFGHPPVLEHELYKGFKDESQLIYLTKTQNIVNNYRLTLAKNLHDAGIPVNLMHPSSMVLGEKMAVKDYNFKSLKGFLSLGMIPFLGGDLMYDDVMGFSVCSGDQLAVVISKELGAKRLIYATDVEGVFTEDPKSNPNANAINEININTLEGLIQNMKESGTLDASGRMVGKLNSILKAKALITNGLEVSILSMMKSGTLKAFLSGNSSLGTKFIYK